MLPCGACMLQFCMQLRLQGLQAFRVGVVGWGYFQAGVGQYVTSVLRVQALLCQCQCLCRLPYIQLWQQELLQ